MILHSDWRDLPQRPIDDALDRGYVPAPEDFRPLPPVSELDRERFEAEYLADIEAAKEFAREHAICGVDNCGFFRCEVCGDRMACTGPEPVAIACGAHDNECVDCAAENRCRECARLRHGDPTAPAAYQWPDVRNSA